MRIYFGNNKDGGIRYDEATLDKVRVDGADWEYDNGVALKLSDVTASTNSTTGAFTVAGGIGVAGQTSMDLFSLKETLPLVMQVQIL